MANGSPIQYPLDSVQAVADFLTFDRLPFDGALYDQPARLITEMRLVLSVYRAEEQRRLKDGSKTTS